MSRKIGGQTQCPNCQSYNVINQGRDGATLGAIVILTIALAFFGVLLPVLWLGLPIMAIIGPVMYFRPAVHACNSCKYKWPR